MATSHEKFDRSARYFHSHFDQIREEFPNRFVALDEETVICRARSVRLLLLKLQGIGVDPRYTFVDNTFSRQVRAAAAREMMQRGRSYKRP